MRMRTLASATALVLAIGMTAAATASGHRGAGGNHWRHHHHLVGSYDGRNADAYYGGRYYTDLGPLGFTLGPPPGHGTCGPHCAPGSSIAAWSY